MPRIGRPPPPPHLAIIGSRILGGGIPLIPIILGSIIGPPPPRIIAIIGSGMLGGGIPRIPIILGSIIGPPPPPIIVAILGSCMSSIIFIMSSMSSMSWNSLDVMAMMFGPIGPNGGGMVESGSCIGWIFLFVERYIQRCEGKRDRV